MLLVGIAPRTWVVSLGMLLVCASSFSGCATNACVLLPCPEGTAQDESSCECVATRRCIATVDPANPNFDRFEATVLLNGCSSDAGCLVGGCSDEVCAAEASVTTCELIPDPPTGTCVCVDFTCVWSACRDI